jgi:hypothetical protein
MTETLFKSLKAELNVAFAAPNESYTALTADEVMPAILTAKAQV